MINLYADRMSHVEPNKAAVLAALAARPLYRAAGKKLGLTPAEYATMQYKLGHGGAVYGELPHHVDAMAGLHRGALYVLRNGSMPGTNMGWRIYVGDGKTVIVPRVCSNLALVAGRSPRKRFHNTPFAGYFPPSTVALNPPTLGKGAPVPMTDDGQGGSISAGPAGGGGIDAGSGSAPSGASSGGGAGGSGGGGGGWNLRNLAPIFAPLIAIFTGHGGGSGGGGGGGVCRP